MEISYLDFLESYISSDESFDNVESILEWINNIRENSFSEVKQKPLCDLKSWSYSGRYDSIDHSNNIFFQLRGYILNLVLVN